MKQAVLEAAKRMAKYAADCEPNIVEVYVFPSDEEIRLIELDRSAMPSQDQIAPFYFPPDPRDSIPLPSGIALITPDDKDKFDPPVEWGKWDDAILIWPETGS